MGIEQRTKTMDEGNGAAASVRTGTRTGERQAPLHGRKEDVQGQGLDGWIGLQVIAQALGHR